MVKDLNVLEKKIGLKFKNQNFLRQALTHRSYLNEHPELNVSHNERLEFLGDAVIEFVVTEYLYQNYSEPEGILTSWRAALVNAKNLSQIAKKFNLAKYLYLSKGEFFSSSEKARMTILANTFESLIGALYLDQGLKKTKEFIIKKIITKLHFIIKYKLYQDAKSRLQELSQADFKITPSYRVIKEMGPDHLKEFVTGVFFNEKLIAKGRGKSKQESEIKAAKNALKKYQKLSFDFTPS